MMAKPPEIAATFRKDCAIQTEQFIAKSEGESHWEITIPTAMSW